MFLYRLVHLHEQTVRMLPTESVVYVPNSNLLVSSVSNPDSQFPVMGHTMMCPEGFHAFDLARRTASQAAVREGRATGPTPRDRLRLL